LADIDVPPLHVIYFYITNACNLRCAHCWLSRQSTTVRSMDLTTAEIRDVIDQALPLGLRSIKITGGEPFVRDDIVELVGHADRAGLAIRIESNATLLDEGTARALGQYERLRQVAVSLDGATPASHALLRGAEGAFDKAVQGIGHLVKYGIPVQVITCLHKGNIQEIEDVVALVVKMGAGSVKINPIIQLGRGQEMAEQGGLLDMDEVLALNRWVEGELRNRYEIPIHMSVPLAFQSLATIRRYGLRSCAVMNLLGILPGGEMSICGIGEGYGDLVFANVRQTPVKEAWETSPGLQRIRQEIAAWPSGLCLRCMVKRYCIWGYCRAEGYALLGSLSAPFPFCQAAYDAGLFPSGRLLP
jgi:SynChlorMet cassette radical SAM/SPASM protein ScmF